MLSRLPGLFLSTWLFGPVAGVAYAKMHSFTYVQAFLLITLFDLAVGGFWIGVAEGIFRKRRALYRISLKQVSFLAFTLGEMAATMAAYAGDKRRRAIPYILLFTTLSRTLLILGAMGALLFIHPIVLYLVGVVGTITMTVRTIYHHRELLPSAFILGRGKRRYDGR